MTKIKDISIIILIVFIIASILYGIHMFRYEYIDNSYNVNKGRYNAILRVDRITNDVCLYVYSNPRITSVYIYRGKEIYRCD